MVASKKLGLGFSRLRVLGFRASLGLELMGLKGFNQSNLNGIRLALPHCHRGFQRHLTLGFWLKGIDLGIWLHGVAKCDRVPSVLKAVLGRLLILAAVKS